MLIITNSVIKKKANAQCYVKQGIIQAMARFLQAAIPADIICLEEFPNNVHLKYSILLLKFHGIKETFFRLVEEPKNPSKSYISVRQAQGIRIVSTMGGR